MIMQLGPILDSAAAIRVTGRVREITGLTLIAEGLVLPVGSMCRIERRQLPPVAAQVVGARADSAVLMTLHEPAGIRVGDRVQSSAALQTIPVGRRMLGCVINGLGEIIRGNRDFAVEAHYPVFSDAPPALDRRSLDRPLARGFG
jgi:flagellum-specific ATP synthase